MYEWMGEWMADYEAGIWYQNRSKQQRQGGIDTVMEGQTNLRKCVGMESVSTNWGKGTEKQADMQSNFIKTKTEKLYESKWGGHFQTSLSWCSSEEIISASCKHSLYCSVVWRTLCNNRHNVGRHRRRSWDIWWVRLELFSSSSSFS